MKPVSMKLTLALALAAGCALAVLPVLFTVVTVTEAAAPAQPDDPEFPGEPAPQSPPPFAPERADPPRPDGRELNSSAAAVRLEVRPIRPEGEAHLDKIYPTYQLAVDFGGKEVSPSASLLASKCRQFDDALAAAVSLAAFEGVEGRLPGARGVLGRLAAKLPADSEAADRLGLALELAKCGEEADLAKLQEATRGAERRTRLLLAYLADAPASRPAGFHTWDKRLRGLWYCQSFLDRELAGAWGPAFAGQLGAALRADQAVSADYRRCVELLRLLTGRGGGLTLNELPAGEPTVETLTAQAQRLGRRPEVVFLPVPGNPERALMARAGLPGAGGGFRAVIAAVRGAAPGPDRPEDASLLAGRVRGVEALLVPVTGVERGRLSCTPRYAMRSIESYKAAPVRHRELRWRFGRQDPHPSPGPAPGTVAPHLRVEPAPEFYLRTARVYSALGPALKAILGSHLADVYGLRETWSYGQIRRRTVGERDDDLATEIEFMARLFRGLYRVSCEDLGMAPEPLGGAAEAAADRQAALNWLASFRRDPDLKPDARFCTALAGRDGRSAHWAVVGVRLARLEAGYDWPPSLRDSAGGWQPVDRARLGTYDRLIPVDATVCFELAGPPLTRCEFWELLTAAGTRDGVLEMVRRAGSRDELLRAVAAKNLPQPQPAAP